METSNITTNASPGYGDVVSPDVEETNNSLTKSDTGHGKEVNSHIHDATSVGDQSEQEQTNSGPQNTTGISAESDQQRAAEATADASEVNTVLKKEDQNDGSEKADNAHIHDATSMVNPSEQEQTNSDPKNMTGIRAEMDQKKAAEATADSSEVHAVLKKEDQNDGSEKADNAHIHDATSMVNPSEQEQTNSDPKNMTGIRAEMDQKKAAEATADSSEVHAVLKKEDQNDGSEKADNAPEVNRSQSSSDGDVESTAAQADRQMSDLPLTKAPQVDRSQGSSDDDVEPTAAQTDGPVLPPGQKDVIKESTFTPTLQAKPCLQDDSRPKDLSRNLPVILAVLVIAVIGGLFCLNGSSTQPDPREYSSVDIFRLEFDKMKDSFPSQRAELWKRSRIHLERHLQTAEPTEPVSMILTSGRGAERTLHCLAGRMAAAFSTALGASGASGASVLHVDGAAAAALESDRVKLDIDQRLSGAFEGDGRAAVVHRFEELPPGSTLIFYKYCDHENAAYKKVLLVFTVLLEEDELGPQLALNAVEEMVQERIQDKLLSPDQPASFDRMDMDKLSGLWSRISHLILPVAAEERVEREGCES
ncbi:torsin-1A-interacting protein 2-like isoform X7 [Anguilla anguilla]|uniref:torsin-1A-interacting protein 2-like isoform X7 n=1 Tax=Anguilla anguilla TaxID=7936 RepID=UPI0015A96CB0|nr:torsin-1A-interacting protein 2-like isoform X7 [Anguilla anguilla]